MPLSHLFLGCYVIEGCSKLKIVHIQPRNAADIWRTQLMYPLQPSDTHNSLRIYNTIGGKKKAPQKLGGAIVLYSSLSTWQVVLCVFGKTAPPVVNIKYVRNKVQIKCKFLVVQFSGICTNLLRSCWTKRPKATDLWRKCWIVQNGKVWI